MEEATSKAVTKIDKNWFKENARLGLETISSDDLPIPRLLLVQKTSTNTILRDGNMAKPGSFYYSATKEATETFGCVFLKGELVDMPTFEDRNVSEKVWTFLGAREGDWKPFIFNCRSTSFAAAGNFVGSVLTRGVPMFSLKVILGSRYIESKKGNFFVVAFKDEGVRKDTEQLYLLRDLAKKYGAEQGLKETDVPEQEETMPDPPNESLPEDLEPDQIPF